MSEKGENEDKSLEELINSSPPEQVLAMLAFDLRNSADVIMICAGILSEGASKEDQAMAITDISKHGKFIYDYLEMVLRYVKNRKEQR